MQNIMNGYKFPLQNSVPKNILDLLQKKNLAFTDYLIIAYVTMFIAWIFFFIRNIFKTCRSYYTQENGVLALHKATFANDTPLAMMLIKAYPNAINKTIDDELFTPFLRACYNGNTQLVKYMLRQGADVNSYTARKENGLYLAVYNRIKNNECRDASCIHALYHAGIDINALNANNLNALQLAAMFGHTSLVRWLLSKKANFNVEPSPYFLAKNAGHLETANYLSELQPHLE